MLTAERLEARTVPEILGEIVLSQQGTFRRVRRYLKGWHIGSGLLHWGLQGQETIVEMDVIRPVQTFTVAAEPSIFHFNDQTGMAEITSEPEAVYQIIKNLFINDSRLVPPGVAKELVAA